MDEFYQELIRKLSGVGINSPRLEARLICAQATKSEPSQLTFPLTPQQKAEALKLLQQRLNHKPLDKILGHREFYKSDFLVDENVLSPRPDTEILVEEAIRLVEQNQPIRILDLGTGSGCIIESILAECPNAVGVGVDISPKSLLMAQKNAEQIGVSTRLKFIQADWFDRSFVQKTAQTFDLLVSNPPYIPTGDIQGLDPEVKNYDPYIALDGGADGLDSYRRIAELSVHLLKAGGYILLEAGIGQALDIAGIFQRQGFVLKQIVQDLSHIERCVILQKPVAEIKKDGI